MSFASMNEVEQLAKELFDTAALAQSDRMLTKQERARGEQPHPRKVSCKFQDLFPAPKDHYLHMANYVLTNYRKKDILVFES